MEQVYIFDFGDKLKIGYSTNVNQRLGTIESASGAKARQVYSVEGTRQIEQAVQWYLREHRIRGEYFSCKFEMARHILDGIANGEIIVAPNAKRKEAQKRASNKYNLEHMSTLGCKVKKAQATAFKAYCENQGSTSNTVLKDFVLGCIGEQEPGMAPETPREALGRPAGASLHPQVLKTVQEAAEATGEAVPQFVERAVETQAKRDKSSLALGINPVTGEKLKGGAEE